MRSTNIPPKDKEEAAPLLQDLDAHGDAHEPFEVVVDHPRQLDLYEQILQLIDMLKVIEADLEQQPEYKTLRTSLRCHLIVILGIAITSITAPTLAFTLMRNSLYQDLESFTADKNRRIAELKVEQAAARSDEYKAIDDYENAYKTFFSYMQGFYQQWRQPVGNDYCDSYVIDNPVALTMPLYDYARHIHNAHVFCNAVNHGDETNSERCVKIAEQGCAAYRGNPAVTAELNKAQNDYRRAEQTYDKLDADIWDERNALESTTWLTRTNPLVMIPIVLAIAGIGGLVLATLSCRSERNKYKTKSAPFKNLNHSIPNENQQNELKLFLARIGIALTDDLNTRDVIKQLKKKAKVYKAKRDRRMAFLSGLNPRNAGTHLHAFFARTDKNLLRIILEKADLLPITDTTPAPPQQKFSKRPSIVAMQPVITMQPVAEMQPVVVQPVQKKRVKSHEPMKADAFDLQPLLDAVRNEDAAFLISWCDQGYLLSWTDHVTHKTLLEQLGADGDLKSIEFVIRFYTSLSGYPDLSDAVMGAIAANQPIDVIFSIPTIAHYHGEALEAARKNPNETLRAQVEARVAAADYTDYLPHLARGAAAAGDAAAVHGYVTSENQEICHALLEGAVIGGHDHIVKLLLPVFANVEDDELYCAYYHTALNTAAARGNARLVANILMMHNANERTHAVECRLVTEALATAAQHGQTSILLDLIAHAKLLGMNLKAEDGPLNIALTLCLESQRYIIASLLIQFGARLEHAIDDASTYHWSDAKFIRMFRGLFDHQHCYDFVCSHDAKKLLPLLKFAHDIQDREDINLDEYFHHKEVTKVTPQQDRIIDELKNHILRSLCEFMVATNNIQLQRAQELHDVISMSWSIESIYLLLIKELSILKHHKQVLTHHDPESIYARLVTPIRMSEFSLFFKKNPEFVACLENCIQTIKDYRFHESVGALLEHAETQQQRGP